MKIRFAHTIFSVIALFAGSSVSAQTESFWSRRLPDGSRQILVLHEEPGRRFVADLIQVPTDGMQERVWTREYSSRDAAQTALRSVVANFQSTEGRALREAGRVARTTEVPGSVLWVVTRAWNAEWEKKFSEWIRSDLAKNYFSSRGVATDCADVAYLARWIFARANGLPMGNRLSGTGALFTQNSFRREWLALKPAAEWHKDQRFRAAIRYLQDHTYTHTLLRDSYPVAINAESLVPGVYHLRLHAANGHTQVVRRIDPKADEPLLLTQSTLPVAVRDLFETGFWYSGAPKESEGGFLSMRWIERSGAGWTMRAANAMPGYSKEQYTAAFLADRGFDEAVLAHLHPDLDYRARLRDGMATLKEQLGVRVGIVENGQAFCATHDCRPGTQAYEDWSTPSRDRALRDLVTRLEEVYLRLLRKQDQTASSIQDEWRRMQRETFATIGGTSYSVGAVSAAMRRGSASSDPRDSIAKRWALDTPSIVAFYEQAITENLKTREAGILGQGGACRPASSCEPGSAGWNRWNTFSSDEVLRTLFREVDLYCAFSKGEECDALRDALSSKRLTVAGLNLSFWEWLTRGLFLVSDPREEVAVRWGQGAETREAREWKHVANVVRSREGVIYGSLQGFARITDMRTLRSFDTPVGDSVRRWNAFDYESGLMADLAKTEPGKIRVRVQRLGVGYIYTHEFENSDFDGEGRVLINWLASGVLYMQVSSGSELRIVDFRGPTAVEYDGYRASKAANAFDLIAPGRALVERRQGELVMLDVRETPFSEQPVSLPAGAYQLGSNVAESDTHLMNYGFQCEGGQCRLVLILTDKARGQMKVVDVLGPQAGWATFHASAGARRVLARTYGHGTPDGNHLKLLEFGPSFELQRIQTLASGPDISFRHDECSKEAGLVSWSQGATGLHVARLTDAGLTELPVRADEKEIVRLCAGRAQLLISNDRQRVREVGGAGFVWGEAPQFYLGPQGYLERLLANGAELLYREFSGPQSVRSLVSAQMPVANAMGPVLWNAGPADAPDTMLGLGHSLLWVSPRQ